MFLAPCGPLFGSLAFRLSGFLVEVGDAAAAGALNGHEEVSPSPAAKTVGGAGAGNEDSDAQMGTNGIVPAAEVT